MNAQDIIAILVAVAACAYIGRKLWRSLSGTGGCHCAQADPTGSSTPACTSRTAIKRTPLVTPDQIGRPHADPPTS